MKRCPRCDGICENKFMAMCQACLVYRNRQRLTEGELLRLQSVEWERAMRAGQRGSVRDLPPR